MAVHTANLRAVPSTSRIDTRGESAGVLLDCADEFRRLAADLPADSKLRAHLLRSETIYRDTAWSASGRRSPAAQG
jgi:hypothetical protein